MRRLLRLAPGTALGSTMLLFIVALFIRDIPANSSYTYENGKIIAHSWHDIFESVAAVMTLLILVIAVVSTVVGVILRIKNKERTAKRVLLIWVVGIVSSLFVLLGDIMVVGLWSESDYDPSCYEFTDGRHTIVIEETSFLLYGGGTIYQIKNDGAAVVIGSISTDDGGRNYGKYDIEWSAKSAEITYKTFNTNDSTATKRVAFE